MNLIEAKEALDKVIKKARVHLYKPIQIAEILHRDRIYKDIDLSILDSYRTKSKKWRDIICLKFLGRSSTSSARYQDDLFNKNAIPPEALILLGDENRKKSGIVEAYIYRKFITRYSQMTAGIQYCYEAGVKKFKLDTFFDLFYKTPGLKRSVDKVFEIVVYSLFQVLVEELDVSVRVSLNLEKTDILREFEDFTFKVLTIDSNNTYVVVPAKFHKDFNDFMIERRYVDLKEAFWK